MAAVASPNSVGALPPCVRVSSGQAPIGRVNRVASSRIMLLASLAGVSVGLLASWGWALNPILAAPVAILLALFAAVVYIGFFQDLRFDADDFPPLADVVGELMQWPVFLNSCGHTVDRNTLAQHVKSRGKLQQPTEGDEDAPILEACPIGGCGQKFASGEVIPNRLIAELLCHLHNGGRYADFVGERRLMAYVLPDGRSCDILQQLLLMRARGWQSDWQSFCDEHLVQHYRSDTRESMRVGIDVDALEKELGETKDYDTKLEQQLEEIYRVSKYSLMWQAVVDYYLQEQNEPA